MPLATSPCFPNPLAFFANCAFLNIKKRCLGNHTNQKFGAKYFIKLTSLAMNPRPAGFWAENSHQSNQGSSIAARMMHSGAH